MRTPSIKTLSRVFSDPKTAKAILLMTHAQLRELPAGQARIDECYHFPGWHDVRLHCLNAIEPGLCGLESCESTDGEYAEYLNLGDTYDDTLIFWRGAYRVQSVGDFVETMNRRSVHFN